MGREGSAFQTALVAGEDELRKKPLPIREIEVIRGQTFFDAVRGYAAINIQS
jgi:hypothetical protein